MKRYWRMLVGVVLVLATAAIGFTTRDGTWMLILGIGGLAFMIWPVAPWVAAPDPRQYEVERGSEEPVPGTASE